MFIIVISVFACNTITLDHEGWTFQQCGNIKYDIQKIDFPNEYVIIISFSWHVHWICYLLLCKQHCMTFVAAAYCIMCNHIIYGIRNVYSACKNQGTWPPIPHCWNLYLSGNQARLHNTEILSIVIHFNKWWYKCLISKARTKGCVRDHNIATQQYSKLFYSRPILSHLSHTSKEYAGAYLTYTPSLDTLVH